MIEKIGKLLLNESNEFYRIKNMYLTRIIFQKNL